MQKIVIDRQQWIPTPFLEHEVKESSPKAWKFEYRDRFGRYQVKWISKEYSQVLQDEEGKMRWHLRPFLFNKNDVLYFMKGKEGL